MLITAGGGKSRKIRLSLIASPGSLRGNTENQKGKPVSGLPLDTGVGVFLAFAPRLPPRIFFASQQLWFGTFSPAKETQTRQPATQEQESAGERRMADMIIPRIICRIYLVRGNPA